MQLSKLPKTLTIVGAGYIGMEFGTVYASLGSEIVVVEALPTMLRRAARETPQ